jgi:hypothetical protein
VAGAPPHSWRTAAVEALLVVLVLLAFTLLHDLTGTDVAAATANAHRVQSVEKFLHLDIEPATNRWLTAHSALIPLAVLLYRLYYVVLLAAVIWVYVRHANVYLQVRRTFVAMTGIALLVFWIFPCSPPRFALAGIVDIVAGNDILAGRSTQDLTRGANFTAMPSLHVGWSALAAYAVWSALRGSHPRVAMLAWLFPLLMVADVLGTGNHYLLDVAGSGVLLISAIALASEWGHVRKTRDC